ncbi:MAG: class I SAM-dependent methyltransferase [Proteobacteria bacterium]|nr:class I SAM-dependent methyltransferase [Pseudomonadota bacterium]MBU1715997.1 class I SAM-dependent methyltransferase [Pseudomonadota bacterium]
MDLRELRSISPQRHPWETARLKALQMIVRPYFFEGIKVLDVGCGDGFVARRFCSRLKKKEITAVDIHLTDQIILALEGLSGGIRYLKEFPPKEAFNLILLLDVIEHQEDDRSFLTVLVERYVENGGRVLITVPAFQPLYSCHDAFLGHHRRYRLRGLEELAGAAGLKVIASGHLFMSLLIPKLIIYKLFGLNRGADGIGQWSYGMAWTSLVEILLNMDNRLLISAARLGLKLPGLTGWALCEKRG